MSKIILDILPKYINMPGFSGELKKDCVLLLNANDKGDIAEHVEKVGKTCGLIGAKYKLDEVACEEMGYLHDIGGIIRAEDMLAFSRALGFEIYDAEEKHPFLLHQRISAVLAEEFFNIKDDRMLSAIACHSTLKKNANEYDMVLFIADKISWDQEGIPPFHEAMTKELKTSLEKAAMCYMDYIVDNKMVLYPHKWFIEGHKYLANKDK
jgi:HD superfamily phosphohydrolase YqeK